MNCMALLEKSTVQHESEFTWICKNETIFRCGRDVSERRMFICAVFSDFFIGNTSTAFHHYLFSITPVLLLLCLPYVSFSKTKSLMFQKLVPWILELLGSPSKTLFQGKVWKQPEYISSSPKLVCFLPLSVCLWDPLCSCGNLTLLDWNRGMEVTGLPASWHWHEGTFQGQTGFAYSPFPSIHRTLYFFPFYRVASLMNDEFVVIENCPAAQPRSLPVTQSTQMWGLEILFVTFKMHFFSVLISLKL